MDERQMQYQVEKTIEDGVKQLDLEDFVNSCENGVIRDLGISTSGSTLTKDEYKEVYDNFIRNPSLDGFDSRTRMALLFKAVQNEVEPKICEPCRKEVVSDDFAIKFIQAYQNQMADTKKDIKITTMKTAYNSLKQNWGQVAKTIVEELIPLVRQYISTEPSQLNDVDDFPYVIQNGKICHEKCMK